MKERFEELSWIELDGELSADEARELSELRKTGLVSNGSEIEGEIRQLATELDELKPVMPPAELRGQILAAVEKRRKRHQTATIRQFPPPAAAIPSWAKWSGLAAGLVLAVVAYQSAFGPGPEDTSALTGTILPMPDAGTPGPQFDTGLDFVSLRPRGNGLAAILTPGEGAFTFAFRAPGLDLEQIDFRDGATGSYQSEAGGLTIEVRGPGRVELGLVFAEPDRPFAFSVLGEGIEPFDGEFSLQRDSETNFSGTDQ